MKCQLVYNGVRDMVGLQGLESGDGFDISYDPLSRRQLHNITSRRNLRNNPPSFVEVSGMPEVRTTFMALWLNLTKFNILLGAQFVI
jgi:hypothetical protein